MHTTLIYSARPGNGTTTVAAGLASLAASTNQHVLLLDTTKWGDAGSYLGLIPGPETPSRGLYTELHGDAFTQTTPVTPNLSYTALRNPEGMDHDTLTAAVNWIIQPDPHRSRTRGIDLLVIDSHRLTPDELPGLDSSFMAVIPSYANLRSHLNTPRPANGIIVTNGDRRSLDEHDASSVLGAPIAAAISYTPEMPRIQDSGRVAARIPDRAMPAFKNIHRSISPIPADRPVPPRLNTIEGVRDSQARYGLTR